MRENDTESMPNSGMEILLSISYDKKKRLWENCDGVEDELEEYLNGRGIKEACGDMIYGVATSRQEDIIDYYFGHYPPTTFELYAVACGLQTAHEIVGGKIRRKEILPPEFGI